jgi:hypothetical protein
MTTSPLFASVRSKTLFALIFSVFLVSCSTEENFADATTGVGTGGVQGANSEPVSEPLPGTTTVATLSVSASRIKLGDETTLSWDSTNADTCDASGDWNGKRSTRGSQKIKPNKNKSDYTLTCSTEDGSSSDSITVSVIADAPSVPAPVVNLSVSSASIEQGQSATLSWSSSYADSCVASGGWSGTRSTAGSQSVSPSQTAIYTLTCSGAGGSVSDNVSITVDTPPPPAPVVNLSASRTSIELGQSATLSWSTSNASSCSASGSWGGSRSTSGTRSVSPTSTATYILSCSGEGGSASDSVTVTVTAPPPVPVVNLSVSSASIEQGQSATLIWGSTDADSCVASGSWSGTRNTTGSQNISPSQTASYTLTCSGAGGSASDSVTVTVVAPTPAPLVNLSVSSASIEQGQSTALSWSSTNADSCVASGGWSGTRSTMGSQSVSPASTATYTLTCSGAGGSASDSITVTVNDPPASGQDVNLSWVAPAEREDNTPISMSEIAGYRIYYGKTQGQYTSSIEVNDGSAGGYTITGLSSGTYYFVVTTYDVDGRESGYSQAVSRSI